MALLSLFSSNPCPNCDKVGVVVASESADFPKNEKYCTVTRYFSDITLKF
jgi:hypothetical protein